MGEVDEAADVVVVGAGLSGRVAAALLAAAGRAVVVLEREEEVGSAGAGIMLQPNGLAVLYALGLRDALHERATVLTSAPLYDERGEVLSALRMPDFGCGLDHALVLHRRHLASVLDRHLGARSEVEVRTGASVRSAAGDGTVRYEWRGEARCLSAALVVGADGVGSQVRRSGDFGAQPVAAGHVYARMVVDAEPALPGAECWSALGPFGSAPLGDGSTYAYASCRDPAVAAAVSERDLRRFVDLWAAAVPPATVLLDHLASVDDLLVNRVGRVRCDTYVDGRTALIGDAAHAMAPNLGQGANSGMLDAAVLVASVAGRSDAAAGLADYDRERRRRVTAVQRNADRLARIGHLRGRTRRNVRDRAMRVLSPPALVERQIRASQQCEPAEVYATVDALCR